MQAALGLREEHEKEKKAFAVIFKPMQPLMIFP